MAILDSYQRKAKITNSMLNSLEGVTCNEVIGALYAFARVHLPQKAIEEAKVSKSVVHVAINLPLLLLYMSTVLFKWNRPSR